MFRAIAVYNGQRYSTKSTSTDLSSALSDVQGQLENVGVKFADVTMFRLARAVGKQTVRIAAVGARKRKPKTDGKSATETAPSAPSKPAATKTATTSK